MPQVDLETLVSVCSGGGGDRKVGCEPISDADQPSEVPDLSNIPPDFPPESFWLSKDAEYDWFDRNAFYERKDSTKGNSHSTNLNPTSNSNSSSQRFALNLKSKASIIGLPKTQGNSCVDSKRRNCKTANMRLFPKRSGSAGKTVPMTEPSSPKVSCMGRVRSKRGRRKSSESAPEKKVQEGRNASEQKKSGSCCGFMSIFRYNRREKTVVERRAKSPPRKSATVQAREIPVDPAAEPPGLGGMMRFASGRRSSTWIAAEDEDDVVAARLSPPTSSDHRTVRDEGGPTLRS